MPDEAVTGNVAQLRLPGMSWMGDLTRGEKGPHATVANCLIVLAHDPALRGVCAYDEFSHRIVAMRHPPTAFIGADLLPGTYPRDVTDTDITLIQGYIQRVFGMRISQGVAQQAVAADAEVRRIHPVRSWLDSLAWDNVSRLKKWLSIAFGCQENPYYAAVGTKFLCAAVRRVRQPGCKFDYVLVLEGAQGRGKSRACAALFGQDLFTDNLSDDLAHKDAQQGMSGRWGIELGELNHLIRSHPQAAKAFFSRQVDYFRPSYGRSFVERPRQCVFMGTTNEFDWLSDPSGNRRYWPVTCDRARVEWISEFREQLWAEAVVAEAAGEELWLNDDLVAKAAKRHQDARLAEDPWAQQIRTWIAENQKTEVRCPDLLHVALALPRAQQNRGAEMRVASILRQDGWMRHRYRPPRGKVLVAWFAPGARLPGTDGLTVPEGDEDPNFGGGNNSEEAI